MSIGFIGAQIKCEDGLERIDDSIVALTDGYRISSRIDRILRAADIDRVIACVDSIDLVVVDDAHSFTQAVLAV